MSKGSITDRRVRLYPSKMLLQLLNEYKEHLHNIPENVSVILKESGFTMPSTVEILTSRHEEDYQKSTQGVQIKLLNQLVGEMAETTNANADSEKETEKENDNNDTKEKKASQENEDNLPPTNRGCFYLADLHWLNGVLVRLRSEKKTELFLHNLLENCSLEMPQNSIIPRDPELEKRCIKLREEQQNAEYRKITKNVDSVLKNYPEDTISYQMKAMNSQIIAVLQFVFSVVAGFVFGFLGVQLIVGNLDFGFRLLLGIICALVIALAEIYFLAKKLNEYDDVDAVMRGLPSKKKKMHTD